MRHHRRSGSGSPPAAHHERTTREVLADEFTTDVWKRSRPEPAVLICIWLQFTRAELYVLLQLGFAIACALGKASADSWPYTSRSGGCGVKRGSFSPQA